MALLFASLASVTVIPKNQSCRSVMGLTSRLSCVSNAFSSYCVSFSLITSLTMMVMGLVHLVRALFHFPLKIPLIVSVEYFPLVVPVEYFPFVVSRLTFSGVPRKIRTQLRAASVILAFGRTVRRGLKMSCTPIKSAVMIGLIGPMTTGMIFWTNRLINNFCVNFMLVV